VTEFRILGPLDVRENGHAIEVGGGKQRALFALLLVGGGKSISTDRLIDALWGEKAPASAVSSLHAYVSRLRSALGSDRLVRSGHGYQLVVHPDELDVDRFERLLVSGRDLLRAGEVEAAAETLRTALALWRGPPLADLTYETFATDEIARLEELRLDALAERIQADLALGRAQQIVPELEALVRQNPLRERLRGQLMLALYRSGRQAEALETYQRARRDLVEELGIEPSEELRELQQSILRQDAALALRRTQREPGGKPSNYGQLPQWLTPLIGRSQELIQICDLLRGDARLLTLTGPGGSGKTRLAAEVARKLASEFEDGVRFVPLAPLPDPELVQMTIAKEVGVSERGSQDLLESLKRALQESSLLLVLDNFEHLLTAAPIVAELATSAEGVKVLATSRAPLRLTGEYVWPVSPLELAPNEQALDVHTLESFSSVALFVARARAAQPGFTLTHDNAAAVSKICTRLDGLPLAIELAAMRSALLPPQAMLERLDTALPVFGPGPRDAPARQRTLASTIGWSHALLTPRQRKLFRELSIFSGGWTHGAAQVVCDSNVDDLGALVDIHLVRGALSDDGRLSMLSTVKDYARRRLVEAGEADQTAERHAMYFLRLAEQAELHVRRESAAAELARLEVEHDNIRAALGWLIQAPDFEHALQLAWSLRRFWDAHGHYAEGRLWLERALEGADMASPGVVAKALYALSQLSGTLGDSKEARRRAEQSVDICRAHGELVQLRASLNALAGALLNEGNLEGSFAVQQEAVEAAREAGDREGEALSTSNLGYESLVHGNLDLARALSERSVSLYGDLQDPVGEAFARLNLALVARHETRHADAIELLQASLGVFEELGHKEGIMYCLEQMAALAVDRGCDEAAAELLGFASAIRDSVGMQLQLYEQGLHAETLRSAAETLGGDALASALERGRSFTLEEALAAAHDVAAEVQSI